MDLMFQPLRKYADFQGRARRSEYWLFYLFQVILGFLIGFVGGFVDVAMGFQPGALGMGTVGLTLSVIMWLVFFVPNLAVGVRRLHDSNKSGWLLLLGLIPVLGWIALLIFFVLDGTPGPNQYGPDPKGRGADTPTVADTFA